MSPRCPGERGQGERQRSPEEHGRASSRPRSDSTRSDASAVRTRCDQQSPVGNADDRGALLAAFSNPIVTVRQTDKVEPKGVEPSTS